jgi:hypothetical protein
VPASAKSHLLVISHVHTSSRELLLFFILSLLFGPGAGRPREITKSLWHNGCSFSSSVPAQFFLTLAVMVVITDFFLEPCGLAHSRRSSMT